MTLRSPLHDEHLRAGAKLTEFAGWEMPLKYAGVIAEHWAVRTRVGLFDVSHLGKLVVDGPGALEVLDGLLPGRVAGLEEWTAGYNLVLSEEGGIVDDIFVYRRPEMAIVVPNAANTTAVADRIRAAAGPQGASGPDSSVTGGAASGGPDTSRESRATALRVNDARDRWAILALQGPQARDLAGHLLPEANDLRLHAFADMELEGVRCQVARTGYTGEYGFELFADPVDAPLIWRRLLAEGERYGVLPAGLGARDTLRLEMGYPLHGHDITLETNPLEASLGWVVDWDKPAYSGRERLEAVRLEGVRRRLVGLVAVGREIPREGYRITHQGRVVGQVTSGNFSPVLGRGIAMAYVLPEHAQPGSLLTVEVRGRDLSVEVVRPPLIRGWQQERAAGGESG